MGDEISQYEIFKFDGKSKTHIISTRGVPLNNDN